MRLNILLSVTSICLSVSFAASAKRADGGFSAEELKIVSDLLNRNDVVGISESLSSGSPKSMTLAVRINAPRQTVFDVFKDPLKFNYISSLFEEAKVLDDNESSKAYSWASRHQLFSVVGTNTISLFPPRRIDVSIVNSSLGSGNVTFNLYEDGKDKTIFVLAGIVNVESSEWLIRFLVGNSPSMKHAMNVAIGLVVIKGAKSMAEMEYAKQPLKYHRTHGTRKGPIRPLSSSDMELIKPLLNRGTVILTSSVKGGRLDQAAVVEKVHAPLAKFIGAAATPEFYPSMLKAVSNVTILEKTEQSTLFNWTLGLSIFGLTTKSRFTFVPDGVTWEGLEGDLAGAEWRWQAAPDGDNDCIVAYLGWVNIAKSTYILEASMRREPYLEHGFVVGSNMVMLRAVKRAAENAKSSPASKPTPIQPPTPTPTPTPAPDPAPAQAPVQPAAQVAEPAPAPETKP
jgi:hypothetical protein